MPLKYLRIRKTDSKVMIKNGKNIEVAKCYNSSVRAKETAFIALIQSDQAILEKGGKEYQNVYLYISITKVCKNIFFKKTLHKGKYKYYWEM